MVIEEGQSQGSQSVCYTDQKILNDLKDVRYTTVNKASRL